MYLGERGRCIESMVGTTVVEVMITVAVCVGVIIGLCEMHKGPVELLRATDTNVKWHGPPHESRRPIDRGPHLP